MVTELLFSFPGLAIIMSVNARSAHVVRAFLLLRGLFPCTNTSLTAGGTFPPCPIHEGLRGSKTYLNRLGTAAIGAPGCLCVSQCEVKVGLKVGLLAEWRERRSKHGTQDEMVT